MVSNPSELKRDFSPEEIIHILSLLGSDYKNGSDGILIFLTICHGGDSYKLYYYPDSHRFHCYTHCEEPDFDLYELVCRVRQCSFKESMAWIYQQLDLQLENKKIGFFSKKKKMDDWLLLEKYEKKIAKPMDFEHKSYSTSLLDEFADYLPPAWEKERISAEAIRRFQVKYDVANDRMILPVFDIGGKMIGIRVRNFDPRLVEKGMKYIPLEMEGESYRYPTAYALYGLYQNQDVIRKMKKVCIVEAEKSVLMIESFYPGSNYAVAIQGSNISSYQRDMILGLGVRCVQICLDKEFNSYPSPESDLWSEKLLKLAGMFSPYVKTEVVIDTKGLLKHQDAPVDQGKKVFEKLLEQCKFEVVAEEKE